MQHLDEGLLMALLDGELTGAEQQNAENHLRACSECAGRFTELKGFMVEADGLVANLDEPPVIAARQARDDTARRPPRRFLTPRTLAWAAGAGSSFNACRAACPDLPLGSADTARDQ